jgi:hypothetical protein
VLGRPGANVDGRTPEGLRALIIACYVGDFEV